MVNSPFLSWVCNCSEKTGLDLITQGQYLYGSQLHFLFPKEGVLFMLDPKTGLSLNLDPRIMSLPLRLEARFVLLILHHISDEQRGGDCVVSVSLLAHFCGCSDSSVRRQLTNLINGAHIVHGGWRGGGRFVFKVIDLGNENRDNDETPQPTPDTTPGLVARTLQDAVSQPVLRVKSIDGYPTEHKKHDVTLDDEQDPAAETTCFENATSEPEQPVAATGTRSSSTSKSRDLGQVVNPFDRFLGAARRDVDLLYFSLEEKSEIQERVHKLVKMVGEARFSRRVAERVCKAVVVGVLPVSTVERAYKNAVDAKNAGKVKHRFIYFAGAMRTKFGELGLYWGPVQAEAGFVESFKNAVKRAS